MQIALQYSYGLPTARAFELSHTEDIIINGMQHRVYFVRVHCLHSWLWIGF